MSNLLELSTAWLTIDDYDPFEIEIGLDYLIETEHIAYRKARLINFSTNEITVEVGFETIDIKIDDIEDIEEV